MHCYKKLHFRRMAAHDWNTTSVARKLIAIFLFAIPGTNAGSEIVDAIEISGSIAAGDNSTLVQQYRDNYITSGTVVNSFGAFNSVDGTAISPTPIHINNNDPTIARDGKTVEIVIPGINDGRVPLSGSDGNDPRLLGDYGTWWLPPYMIDPSVHLPRYDPDGLAYIDIGTDVRAPFSFSFGDYTFSTSRYGNGYDAQVSSIIFAGLGLLTGPTGPHPVQFFLATYFDRPTTEYDMLISSLAPLSAATPLAPVPTISSISALGGALLVLGFAGTRGRRLSMLESTSATLRNAPPEPLVTDGRCKARS